MKQLPYIEDYILLMTDDFLAWPPSKPLIKLARYDAPIVNSMANQINTGLAFTDRQSVLAHKIVVKYRKQWTAAGYLVEHLIEQPVFKNPIRVIDRSRLISVRDGAIAIQFPYDQELISHVRAAIGQIPGSLYFNKDKKYWQAGLTEQRFVWAKEFGLKNGFEFSEEFEHQIQQLLSVPDYSICLKMVDDKYQIVNAADSVYEYLSGIDDLIRLCDLSSILVYAIDYDLATQVIDQVGREIYHLISNKEINLEYKNRHDLDLSSVISYAKLTNRFPIYVYETSDGILREHVIKYFSPEEIVLYDSNRAPSDQTRVVICNKWQFKDVTIPLLVTMHTLMIGSKRQQMLQNSEKVVYYTQKVDSDA